jgi:pyruvate/2-oxoglutarate dehydrogenase complex dihydrolipoamide acyltransferase (E2) component
MTYESDEDGVLSILAAEGQTVPVGEPIARIATPGGRIASAGEPDEDVFDFVAGKRNEPRYDLRMMGAA